MGYVHWAGQQVEDEEPVYLNVTLYKLSETLHILTPVALFAFTNENTKKPESDVKYLLFLSIWKNRTDSLS